MDKDYSTRVLCELKKVSDEVDEMKDDEDETEVAAKPVAIGTMNEFA